MTIAGDLASAIYNIIGDKEKAKRIVDILPSHLIYDGNVYLEICAITSEENISTHDFVYCLEELLTRIGCAERKII